MRILTCVWLLLISNYIFAQLYINELAFVNSDLEIANTQLNLIDDSVPTFVVDDYPVTDSMFKMSINRLKLTGLTLDDQIWFSNDTLNQTLVFDIYTDYYRVNIFHFLNDDIPEELLKKIALYMGEGGFTSEDTKTAGFIFMQKNTSSIAQNYFTSNKGFSLRDSKNKAIETYGYPDTINVINGVEKLRWNFIGEIYYYDHKIDLKGKPIAESSFGHSITMFFREERLIGMLLENDVP